MSCSSTQGVGAAAACANADVVMAISAAAIKGALVEKSTCVENPVMMHPPNDGYSRFASSLNKPRTSFLRQYDASVCRRRLRRDIVIFPGFPASRFATMLPFKSKTAVEK